MRERIGTEISKRYDIDSREIGSGGYGKVFVAKDREMKNRLVAIKKVIVFDEEKKKAFQKEVEIMKELDHPNICKLLETYEQGRFMFFVMEFCEGREVFDRIMDHGMIDENTTADIIRQSASALKYAHKRGIAHRDMKPENICFASKDVRDNRVKVIDWGLGFYFGECRMSSAVGSLTYAAPEVLEARDVQGYTSACDLWSLGVLSYVMLCGKPPFWGNYPEQLRRMKKEVFPMSDSTWQAISPEAKDFIKALLKNNPKDRFSIDATLQHPWLRNSGHKGVDSKITSDMSREILCNLKQFSNKSKFFSLCVASVARQLDPQSLIDVHKVFVSMDENRDGVLSIQEVREGFTKIYGPNSDEVKDIENLFKRLDLDGSGEIDYTEFCAAGMGERMATEENTLMLAFKNFDVHDDDGKISREEITQVLRNAGVNSLWTNEYCEELATELVARYDEKNDGTLDFEEWVKLMRNINNKRKDDGAPARSPSEIERLAELERTQAVPAKQRFDQAYNLLVELDRGGEGEASKRSSPLVEEGSPARSSRAVSGGLAAMSMVRNNTPTCFICSGEPRDSKCQLM